MSGHLPLLPRSPGAQIVLSKDDDDRKSARRVPKGVFPRAGGGDCAPALAIQQTTGPGAASSPAGRPVRRHRRASPGAAPAESGLGFLLAGRGTPALPGPVAGCIVSVFGERGSQPVQGNLSLGEGRGPAKLEKVVCDHLRGRGVREISGAIPLSFPKPYKTAHGDAGDLPNPRRTGH